MHPACGRSDRKRGSGTFSLSPSIYHQALLARTPQTLAWRGGDFASWRRRLRARVAERTGFAAMNAEPRVALAPRTIWKRKHPLGSIEKIVFTAEPDAEVLAYLCVPHDVKPPWPLFICLQGHSSGMHNSVAIAREDDGAPVDIEGDRDFGIGCLRRGIAALCVEQRSFGERREQTQKRIGPHGCWDASMQALMLGRSLVGQRVFDVDRAIDYLAQRGDVDMRRLGVMGNSGGGTTTLFAAALLDRVRIAMPSCYFCTFRDSIMAMYHCVCNYVPGLLAYAEMADILGLFAPRPVVVVAGRKDPIFPIAATRSEFKRLKAIYAAAGADEKCHLVVGPEGHRFYADLAWPVALRELGRR